MDRFINECLDKYRDSINKIGVNKIDCVTIFSSSDDDYIDLNNKLSSIGKVIDNMSSGNLYHLNNGINTLYGTLYFIKVRKYDSNYDNYSISVDFTVDDYNNYKNNLVNPVVKEYDSFELIQFKDDYSIINVVSVSAKDDYKL